MKWLWIVLLIAIPGTAFAPWGNTPPSYPLMTKDKIDLPVLRDIICQYEVRGEAKPQRAFSTAGALGPCQIKPGTWDMVEPVKFMGLIFDKHHARVAALKILKKCYEQKRRGVYGRAYCYYSGFYSEYGDTQLGHEYAKSISTRYATHRLKQLYLETRR